MKTIKLLLCVLLTAMSLNVFADEVGRYQMLHPSNTDYIGVYVLDTKTGAIKYCYLQTVIDSGVECISNLHDNNGIKRRPITQ